MPAYLDKKDEAMVREMDAGLKNKFRWDWLSRTLQITVNKETQSVCLGMCTSLAYCEISKQKQKIQMNCKYMIEKLH